MDNNFDPYFKKNLSFKNGGQNFVFRVSQELFSSQIVDYGTQRLLRTLSTLKLFKYEKVLDLGCGYGPIGIILKRVNPKCIIHMVDRDALALDYTRQNAELNNVGEVKAYGSLGYDNIQDNDFDLIISNIPAKVGKQVLNHMLLDAQFHLKPNGLVTVVVIDAILEDVSNILKSNKQIEITFEKVWPGHKVFHYKFLSGHQSTQPTGTALSRGIYDRTDNPFLFNQEKLLMKTSYNLQEFDTLSFETSLVLNNLNKFTKKNIDSLVIFNPGQGYIPVALSKLKQINKLILVDRNLQSLEVSRRNLIINKFPENKILICHNVGVLTDGKQNKDYVIGIVPEKQNNEVYEMFISQSIQQLEYEGLLILASNSNVMSKIEKNIHSYKSMIILDKKQSKGKKIIIAKKNKDGK